MNSSKEMCRPYLIIIQSCYSDYNLSHVLVTRSAFRALFTWSRRITHAKDHRLFFILITHKSTRSRSPITWFEGWLFSGKGEDQEDHHGWCQESNFQKRPRKWNITASRIKKSHQVSSLYPGRFFSWLRGQSGRSWSRLNQQLWIQEGHQYIFVS